MVYKKRSPYAKKRAYRRKARVPPRKPAPSFDKRVKTVISRMAENKTQNFRTTVDILPYNATNWSNTIVPITPDTLFLSVLQGTGQGDRIGNSIRVKSLKLSGVLRPMPYDATTNVDPVPLYVKMFFLTRKDNPSAISTSLGDVLQFGNASEGPGNSAALTNMQRPVNTNEWTVHATRIFKVGYAIYSGTSADINAQSHSNNDFKLNQFVNIDLTKYCTKNIKFDDNSSNPTSRNIVMYPIVYTANASLLLNNQIPAKFDYNLDIVYEDM